MNEQKIRFKKFVRNTTAEEYIKNLKKKKVDFSLRQTSETSEVIIDDTHYIFALTKNFPANKVYLFSRVNREAKKFIESNSLVVPENRGSVVFFHDLGLDYDIDEKPIAGIDLNHAYWRIAYLNKIISKDTYIRGLGEDSKALRLATISVLGREKVFYNYENGFKTDSFIKQKLNPELRNVYDFVRLSCFNYMYELAQILHDDFFCYKTDGIYFHDDPKGINIKTVRSYFDSKKLTYKQLSF